MECQFLLHKENWFEKSGVRGSSIGRTEEIGFKTVFFIIIWQGSPEVNPSVVNHFAIRTVPTETTVSHVWTERSEVRTNRPALWLG